MSLTTWVALLTLLSFGSSPAKASSSFLKLFEEKRLLQLDAIRRLQQLPEEQSNRLMHTMMERIMQLVKEHSNLIQSLPADKIVTVLEEDSEIDQESVEKVALVCESTCLMADLVLRFPDLSKSKLESNEDWNQRFSFGLQLIDNVGLTQVHQATAKLVKLVRQELELVPREDDYVNPFSKRYKEELEQREREKETERERKKREKEKKERRKSKRGPKLVKTEF